MTCASSGPLSSWRKWPGTFNASCGPGPPRPGTADCSTALPSPRRGVTVGERGQEGAGERPQDLQRPPILAGAFAVGGQAHEQGKLAGPGTERLVGEGSVVGLEHRGGHVAVRWHPGRRGWGGSRAAPGSGAGSPAAPIPPRPDRRPRRGRPRSMRRPARRSAVWSTVLAATTPANRSGRRAKAPRPIGPPQSCATSTVPGQCPVASRNSTEPAGVVPHRVVGPPRGLVGAAEADEIGRDGPVPLGDDHRDDRPVEVRPRGLSVQQEHRASMRRAGVDVVHAQPRADRDVVGLVGVAGSSREPRLGCAHDLHGPILPAMNPPGCDVAIVGGGLVGLALAYELATRDVTVTVIDASLPGRATAAGAGILSPDTSADEDPDAFVLGRRRAGTTTRRCSSALAPRVSTWRAPATPSAAPVDRACGQARSPGSNRSPTGSGAFGARGLRDLGRPRRRISSHRSAPCTGSSTAPGRRGSTGAAWPRPCVRVRRARGVRVMAGMVCGLGASGARAPAPSNGSSSRGARRALWGGGRGGRRLERPHGGVVGRTAADHAHRRARSSISRWRAPTETWPIVATTADPLPGAVARRIGWPAAGPSRRERASTPT